MQIRQRTQIGDVHVWTLDGGIDGTTHDQFMSEMQTILHRGDTKVVLDLKDLTYISSMGLGTLVRVHSRFKAAGARLKFAHLHTAVGKILHLSRLDSVFDLYNTVDDAVRSFAK
jgi:anti-sigma B factor antagonist